MHVAVGPEGCSGDKLASFDDARVDEAAVLPLDRIGTGEWLARRIVGIVKVLEDTEVVLDRASERRASELAGTTGRRTRRSDLARPRRATLRPPTSRNIAGCLQRARTQSKIAP
jgi:hypothetical protein